MTLDSIAGGVGRILLPTMAIIALAGATAVAKNNDGSTTTCDGSLSPKDFVECICDEEGGIFWETDTEYGCWQLEPGELDYRCLKGQPLSSCVVTLPASQPPDEEPEKSTIPGAVSGGPGGGEVASVDSTESAPSAPDFEAIQQSGAPDSFAPFDVPSSDDEVDGFRADTASDDNADSNGAVAQQSESTDDESAAGFIKDTFDEFDPSDKLQPEDRSNPSEPQASIESRVASPCGAGAASATVMLIVGLSLIGRFSPVNRSRQV